MPIPIHYVPVLIWKRAEHNALKYLNSYQKSLMTPLIELVMPKPEYFKDKEKKIRKTEKEVFNDLISEFRGERIPKIPEEIRNFWGENKIYIDFSLLYTVQLKEESIRQVFTLGSTLGLNLIPVLNLNDNEQIKKAACFYSNKSNGICIRIVAPDLLSIKILNERLESFIKSYGLKRTNVDLLIDLKEKVKDIGGIYSRLINSSQMITNLLEWRNFIFSSGSFPEDLTKCNIDESNLVPRLDWLNWYECTKNGILKRIPTFSDYTIRHPIYNESSQFFAPTTSIKYTRRDAWLIMKGKKQKFELYLANAKLLSNDSDIFYGKDFSYGDKYIAEKGLHYDIYIKNRKIKGTGSTETWLTAGINHHMVCTIHQLANLSEHKDIR